MKSLTGRILLLVLLAYSVLGLAGITSADGPIRANVDSFGGQSNGPGDAPCFSASGRYIVFQSNASNLVPGIANGFYQVFVHDLATGQTTCASVNNSGTPGNSHTGYPHISADGRYVVFTSTASNLVPFSTWASQNVYVHDCQTGQTALVSTASDGTPGNAMSWYPSISADGRYVAFSSSANNLVPGDTNGQTDVFVHDCQTGATVRANVDSFGGQANGTTEAPQISPDGRYVGFRSDATNLVPGDTNGCRDAFVRDLLAGQTTRVSVASGGGQANGPSNCAISVGAGGHLAVFSSAAANLVSGDTNGVQDVFMHNLDSGQTVRVSVSSGGVQGNAPSADSYAFSMSGDGRRIVFTSDATNLVPGDTNGLGDVFMRDLATGQTSRVNVDANGAQANNTSGTPTISAAGDRVAWVSAATNLVAGDTNGRDDVFVSGLAPANQAPVAAAGPDQTVEGTAAGGASVTLNASASSDPDGNALAYTWREASQVVAGPTNQAVVQANLAVGQHTLTLTVADGQGETASDTAIINVVAAGPSTTLDLAGERGDNNWFVGDVTVTLSATDLPDVGWSGVTSIHTVLDGGPEQVVPVSPAVRTASTSFVISAEGVHTLEAWAVDAAGNAGAHATVQPRIDETPPTTTVQPSATGAQMQAPDATVVWYRINDGQWRQTTPGSTVPLPADGNYAIEAYSVDAAGNEGPHVTSTIQIDKTAPQTTITPARPADKSGTYTHAVTVSLAATDNLSGVEWTKYSLDGGATWLPYSSPIDLDQSRTYTVQAYSRDRAGNEEAPAAQLTLAVQLNRAPVAVADTGTTDEDAPLIRTAGAGVLSNDTDADGDTLIAVLVSGPTHGTLTLSADGAYTYTPAADYNGLDSFTYKANDGSLDSNVATVTLHVAAVNDAPVAHDDSGLATDEDVVPSVTAANGVLKNDTDVDSTNLTAQLVTGPTNGTLTLQPDGSFVYTPNVNWHGTDTFAYRTYDGSLYSDLATVTIVVRPVNDAPIAEAGPDQTLEGNAAGGANVSLDGSGSSDVEGDTLTYLWTWTDKAEQTQTATDAKPTLLLPVGETTVTLVVNDGQLASAADTVKVTVTDTKPPTIADLTASPNQLWPPNGKMRDVTLAYTVADIVDTSCEVALTVTCNEADFKLAEDVQQVDKTHLKLRAKRDGKSKDGRIYTITVTATDDAGHQTQAQVTVTVPHDQGQSLAAAQIGSAAAIGTAAGAQIMFSLSSEAEVAVVVTNIAGRPVRQLAAGQACTAGVNTLLWNGRSDRGTSVPAGMYLVRILARTTDGAQTSALTTLRLGR